MGIEFTRVLLQDEFDRWLKADKIDRDILKDALEGCYLKAQYGVPRTNCKELVFGNTTTEKRWGEIKNVDINSNFPNIKLQCLTTCGSITHWEPPTTEQPMKWGDVYLYSITRSEPSSSE